MLFLRVCQLLETRAIYLDPLLQAHCQNDTKIETEFILELIIHTKSQVEDKEMWFTNTIDCYKRYSYIEN